MTYFIIPVDAYRRRHELTTGEWDLFVAYCSYRNQQTGRCDPKRATLMREMDLSYFHFSHLKSALVAKRWLAKDGRDAVVLLVGEFPPLKVEELRKIANKSCEKSQLSASDASKVAKNRKQSCEKSQISRARDPYSDEQLFEQEAAAAPAPGARPTQATDPLLAEVTEEFVEDVIAQQFYPEHVVRHVWKKLKSYCRAKQTIPVVKQFLYWLGTEDYTKAPLLPVMGATIHEVGQAIAAAPRCDHTCPHCFGSGMEVVEGKGARRCRGMETATVTDEGTNDERRTAHN